MLLHIVAGKIDAASEAIAADILPEVHQLQARADGIRHRDERRITAALQRQHDPPHGIGGVAAVGHERVAIGIPHGRAGRVERPVFLECIEQMGKWLDREAGLTDGFGKCHVDRMPGPAREALFQSLPPGREIAGGLRGAGRLVGEIVAPPRIGIDIGQVLPQPWRHEPRGHGEVLIVPAGHVAAEALRGGEVAGRGDGRTMPRRRVASGGLRWLHGHRHHRLYAVFAEEGLFFTGRAESLPLP